MVPISKISFVPLTWLLYIGWYSAVSVIRRNVSKENSMKKLAAVITALLCAASVYAQSTEELMQQGTMLIHNGAFDQAVSCFRKVVSRDQGNFEAQFNLAFAYLNWGQNAKAVDEFRKAAALNSSSTEVWSNMAVAYQNLGRIDDAVSALDKAIKLNPNNMQARLNVAMLYGNKEKYDEAVNMYKQIIAIDATQIDAYVNAAKCLLTQKKYAEAEQMLRKGLAQNPEEAELSFDLGNLFWERDHNADSATAYMRRAISLDQNKLEYHMNLALILEIGTDKPLAISTWKECLAYASDISKKDEIQHHIDALEGRSSSGAAATGVNPYAGQLVQKVKRDEAPAKPAQNTGVQIKGDTNVDSDLKALQDTTGQDRFKIVVKKK